MKLAEIYFTFQGEVNVKGIGAPAIFVRLAGCHLRCYKKTLGTLCDTPQFLSKEDGIDRSPKEIFNHLEGFRKDTGCNLVCLTGGDPLWNREDLLHELFSLFNAGGYQVSVETSGVDNSWVEYVIYPNLTWVVDWKLKSAGIPNLAKRNLLLTKDLFYLRNKDHIKFVVYDKEDWVETLSAIEIITKAFPDPLTRPTIAVGPYWGGKLTPFDILGLISHYKLGDKVVMNFQTHKALWTADYSVDTARLKI